jgi:hypothetical protein
MDMRKTRAEYEALPDRQVYAGVPQYDELFRDSGYPRMVFQCVSDDHGHWPAWWAFQVRIAK